MSTEFGYIETMQGELNLTRFWGGADNGVAVQLTPANGDNFVQLSMADCYKLHLALAKVFNFPLIREEK